MTEYHIPGLWMSECHPVEDGMNVKMPEGYAVVSVAALDAFIEYADRMRASRDSEFNASASDDAESQSEFDAFIDALGLLTPVTPKAPPTG